MTDPEERNRRATDHANGSRSRLLVILAVIVGITASGGVSTSVYSIVRLSEQGNSLEAQQQQIQQERVRNIREACETVNERNRATIATLDREIAAAPPERQARATEARDATVRLLNAIIPARDCDKLVRAAVPSGDTE